MATITVLIKNGKAVGCVDASSGFISFDGTVVIADKWCVQVRDSRIICDTRHSNFFEAEPLHLEFPMYFQNGELFLTESSSGARNAYFFGMTLQGYIQQVAHNKQNNWSIKFQ